MAISQLRDDNGQPLQDPASLRPVFSAAGIAAATTGVAIAELDIAALNVLANRNAQGEIMLRVAVISNACYFSLGAAGAAPATSATMMLLPSGSVTYMRARSTDVSAYHQQISGAGTLQVVALS